MHVGIVVSDPSDWTAQALYQAFAGQSASVTLLDFSKLLALIDESSSFCSSGTDLLKLDRLVVRDLGRRGAQDVAFRFETLQHLQSLGLAIVNPPQAIARAANKFATSLALQRAGVPTPRTAVTTSSDHAAAILSEWGRAVCKPLFGYKGRGIHLLSSEESDGRGSSESEEMLSSIMDRDGLIYLQEFIAHPEPRDIRAFVVNGRVLGAIYRIAPPGQWISNLARGGLASPCPLTPDIEELAARSSRAVGTAYCGVDLLETEEGHKVIEVNGTPSGKGIFEALGVNVADAIAGYVLGLEVSKKA